MNVGIVPRGDGLVSAEDLISLIALPVKRAEIVLNDVFTADEFTIELDGRVFPTDPRTIRCFAVDVHIADVGSPTGKINTGKNETRVLVGHADEIERSYNNQALSFKAKGRDYTGLLLDTKWGDRSVELGRSVGDIVAEVVASIPATADLEVVPEFDVIATGNPKSKKRNTYRAPRTKTVWEGLTQLAIRAGAIVEVQGDKLFVRRPRTIDANSALPVFVEGVNLTKLTITRKLGKTDLPNIRVRSFDQATGKTVLGQWPKDPTPTTRATKSKKKQQIDFEDHLVNHPAPTVEILNETAKQIFTYRAFQQIAVELETREMVGQDQDGNDVSLTKIRNGSSLILHVSKETRDVLERNETPDEKARILERQGFETQVAKTLVDGVRTIDAVLFVDRARHSYTPDNGYTLSVTAINVLDVGEL